MPALPSPPTPSPRMAPQPPSTFHDLVIDWRGDIANFLRHDAPRLIFLLILAFVLQQVVSFFVNRMQRLADKHIGNARRASQLRTLAAILRATSYGVITFLLVLEALPLFNIDLKPLLASAGVVGLGISFGAQSIFKDMLNGMFILLEDQFNVGDVIKVAGLTGTVEDLSLRATTLRDGDGTVYFVPNSQIATVSNFSREYSIASLSLSVDASADPDRVMASLRTIATEVRHDPAFAEVAVGDPDVSGVDHISGHEIFYSVNIRVKANQRDGVLRELRRRILQAFERDGIALGTPTNTVLMQGFGSASPSAATAAPTSPLSGTQA